MKRSKLIAVLKSFDKKELRSFGDFLASPYFNKNTDLLRLYEMLSAEAPEYDPDKTDRYLLWRRLHPKRPPDDREIKYLMGSLLRLAERFLGQQVYEGVPMLSEYHSVEACEARQLDKHYRLYVKRLQKAAANHPFRNEEFFLHQHQVAGVAARYFSKQQVRTFDQNLQDTVDFLDIFYLIKKLRLTCELVNRQHIISSAYDTARVDELVGFVDQFDWEAYPAMDIYRSILLLLTSDPGRKQFRRLKALLAENLALFPDSEKQEIYSYAQNFCIQMVKAGEPGFLEELFELYQTGLDEGLFIEDGTLSPWKFKNIVSGGLRLGRFEWVERFIVEYQGFLPADYQETALKYNRANLHYHLGEHAEALRLLQKVEFTDVFYSLDTRKMMLMIYFEQGELEALASLIASFRLYLQRNKLLSERNKVAYKHFLSAVQYLFRVAEGKSVANLEAKIRDLQPLVEEEWLLRMAEQHS